MPLLLALLLSVNTNSPLLTIPIATTTPQDIWVEHLHECENPDNIEKILDTNNRFSYGFVMFQQATWLSFGKDFGATKENIGNDDLQIIVAEDMLNKGLWRHWYTCAQKTTKLYGEYPKAGEQE